MSTHSFINKKGGLIISLIFLSTIAPLLTPVSSAEVADMVLVRVNDEVILKSELDRRLAELSKAEKSPTKADPKEVEKDILGLMIETRLVLLHAKENNIYVSEKEVDEILNDIAKSNSLSREALETAIKNSGVSLDYYKENIREQRITAKVISREVNSKIQISDQDVSDYYEVHKGEFKSEEGVRARHILISLSPNASKEKEKSAKNKIQDILTKIKGGEDFARMAELYSDDASASVGGDLGFFKRGEMIKAFEDAAFSLNPGETSGIVATKFGYHIIRVEEKKGQSPKELAEVSDEIKNIIYREKSIKNRKAFIENLRKNAVIEIKDQKTAPPEKM